MGITEVPCPPVHSVTPARLKIALLSQGVCFPLDIFKDVQRDFYANQYVYGRTSRGALRSHRIPQALNLGKGVIAAVLRNEESPWELKIHSENVFLTYRGQSVREIELPERPGYFGKTLSNGMRSDDFIAVAGEVTPGFFLYPDCHYFPDAVPCSFCSLRHARKTAGKDMASIFTPESVAEATRLFQRTKWKDIPIISITTGTFPDNDEGARYTSKIIRAIYEALEPKIGIHVLTMPPQDLGLIDLYRKAGATSIAFNLEVFDRDLFLEICPGKERFFGYEKMFRAMKQAAGVFGEYRAFCGFVWGLESIDSVLEGYRWCLENKISVSSNVFHADQGSIFAQREHPTEEYILALSELQSELYLKYPDARTIFPVSMRSTLDWEIHRGDFR